MACGCPLEQKHQKVRAFPQRERIPLELNIPGAAGGGDFFPPAFNCGRARVAEAGRAAPRILPTTAPFSFPTPSSVLQRSFLSQAPAYAQLRVHLPVPYQVETRNKRRAIDTNLTCSQSSDGRPLAPAYRSGWHGRPAQSSGLKMLISGRK